MPRYESIAEQAKRLNAKRVSERFARENRHILHIVAARPNEPSLGEDTILYKNSKTGDCYQLVRVRR